eukprot:2984531-Prymnesium_polylepis.2
MPALHATRLTAAAVRSPRYSTELRGSPTCSSAESAVKKSVGVWRSAPICGTSQPTPLDLSELEMPTSSPSCCSVTSGCVQIDLSESSTYQW